MANTVLQNISQDERQRAIFRSRRIAWRDREHDLAIARQEKDTAVAQALQEKQIDFVIKLLRRGRPLIEIAEDTGLPQTEIEKLRAQL
jgi:hypothetical protein